MDKYDVIVIGGGLLGSFAARSLMRYKLKIALLEKREDLCTGVSRANTAIVYSGCDTKPGTLKSQMCVRAAQTFGSLCHELGVRYAPCGSLMICFGPNGEETLRKKMTQGLNNGVRGLKLLTREEVLALEPDLSPRVHMGLYAPEAGTVIPWELGLAAAENAVSNGAEIILNTNVTAIENTDNGYKITGGDKVYYSRGIINCAGLFADEVLEKVQQPSVRIFPAAGDYYVLDTKAQNRVGQETIHHVIFHEPEEKGKGLTIVPTVDGNILIGPSRVSSDDKENFTTSRDGLDRLNALVEDVIPSLPMAHVIRSFGAIRPNPFFVYQDRESGAYIREDRGISNFIIHESENNPTFLSLIGIKTPGLTCANELGIYVSDKMAALLGPAEHNPDFNPRRAASLRLNDLSVDERARLVNENAAYGRIVCRCRKITEGEIIDSIRGGLGAEHANRNAARMFPHAVTVDGVKRRTGACSGRCQGSFCTQRIIEIIASELGVSPDKVNKDGPGSYVIGGGTDDAL